MEMVEMLFVIGGVGLVFATAVAVVVVRARRRRAEDEVRAAAEREARRQAEEVRRRAEEEARAAAEREAQREAGEARRRAEEEARAAAEREAQRQLEDARRRAEEEARAAEQEAQREAEEARRRAEEEARAAAEREARRQAEEARRRAEEEARAAAAQEAQREAEEARRRAEEEARAAAERDAQRQLEEARKGREGQARLTVEEEAPQHATGPERREMAPPEPPLLVERRSRGREHTHAAEEPPVREVSAGGAGAVAAGGGAQLPVGGTPARRRAPQYRPPSGAPSVPRQAPAVEGGPEPDGEEEAGTTARALPVEVRVLFDRGGCCRVTLLPKRYAGLPEECAASLSSGESLELVALEDEWYQDVAPDDLGNLLRTGAAWASQNAGQEWLLAGREIFVLAAGTTHRGFVSCPRLTLGREHVVLCATTRLTEVEDALQSAGCTNRTVFREEDGAPSGWALVGDVDKDGRSRGLSPTCAVPMKVGSDILNVLRPLPEIEILLEGGVPLGHSSWLAGFPPLIRVLGDAQHVQRVLIDGKEATIEEDAGFRAPGWDDPGAHQVWCSNVSRSYSLVALNQSWPAWPAYMFSSASGSGDRLAICGPLVRPLATEEAVEDAADAFERSSVLQTNPVLLGAVPGQVLIATPRRDMRGARCFVRPPFEAVWALPAEPLHCDKATSRVVLVASPGADATLTTGATTGRVSQWCRLILDASRKGLSIEPAAARDLWAQYKRFARNLWRKSR